MASADSDKWILEGEVSDYADIGIKPTDIWVHQQGDTYMVHVPALGEYGSGKTLKDALEDLARGIKWFYDFLCREEKYLSKGLEDDLTRFRALVIS